MRLINYVLKDGVPVPEPDWDKWQASWHARWHVRKKIGPYEVSTVFLGVDHSHNPKDPPILWETMVFGKGPLDGDQDRCSGTVEQAEAMHNEMVKRVKESL